MVEQAARELVLTSQHTFSGPVVREEQFHNLVRTLLDARQDSRIGELAAELRLDVSQAALREAK